MFNWLKKRVYKSLMALMLIGIYKRRTKLSLLQGMLPISIIPFLTKKYALNTQIMPLQWAGRLAEIWLGQSSRTITSHSFIQTFLKLDMKLLGN